VRGTDRCGVHALQKYFNTALHWASKGGHVECARLLLDRGAGVDDVSSWLAICTHGMAWALRGVRRARMDVCVCVGVCEGWLGVGGLLRWRVGLAENHPMAAGCSFVLHSLSCTAWVGCG
jgi:hypothetical protein